MTHLKTRPKKTQPKRPTAAAAGNLRLMNVLRPLSCVKAVTGHLSLPLRRATEPIAASLPLNIAISEPLLITYAESLGPGLVRQRV